MAELVDIEIPDLTIKESAEQPILVEINWPPSFEGFEIIGKLEEIPQALTFDDRFPEIKEKGSVSYSFQFKGQTFIFLVYANKISERLYYSIYNSYNERVLGNQAIGSFPVNLNLTTMLDHSEILFYNNTIYYKEVVG